MGDYQVTCINKKGDHFEPHERTRHAPPWMLRTSATHT
jgi:hypothetical protein